MTHQVTNKELLEFIAKNDATLSRAAEHFKVGKSLINKRFGLMYHQLGVSCLASAVWKVFVEGRPCDFEKKILSSSQRRERRKKDKPHQVGRPGVPRRIHLISDDEPSMEDK